MHTMVTGVRTVKAIGDKSVNGMFYAVNVKVLATPKIQKSPCVRRPDAVVVDGNGTKYSRNEQAESAAIGRRDLGGDDSFARHDRKGASYSICLMKCSIRVSTSEKATASTIRSRRVLVDDEDSICRTNIL